MNIVVILGGLVTGTAGTVEGRARVNTRSCDVTAVLAREGIASAASGRRVGQGNSGRSEEGSDSSELHGECLFYVSINDWMMVRVDQIVFGLGIAQFHAGMAPYLG